MKGTSSAQIEQKDYMEARNNSDKSQSLDIENDSQIIKSSCSSKKRSHPNYKFIEYTRRVDVIYDNRVHGMTPLDIMKKYGMKYNTIRSIINNFKTNNRVQTKLKIKGYTK